MTDLAISTRGLTRRFGPLTAVDDVTLEVPEAQIFGFLGPNGSGKTTTIRMMCGLLAPTAGKVEVLGLSMPRGAERLRRLIGYMTQSFSLYEDLSVDENLQFMGQIHSVARRPRRQRIDELVERYDLGALRRQRAGTMSGGERQRLALAAATLHRPRLLFLDEPTSAVDPESRRDFWEALFELADGGTTILVSTHYMDEAERCHRLAILDRGAVVAHGTPRALGEEIGLTVVEVEAGDLHPVKTIVPQVTGVVSSAQLGSRLRILVELEITEPEQEIQRRLTAAGLEATVRRVTPNLEDVFVAATR